MKKGDFVLLNCIGNIKVKLECIAIYGGTAYYGIDNNVVISGVIWELFNNNTIQLKNENI